MKHDPFYNQILSKLGQKLDPDTFEACTVELIRDDGYVVVPILGGDDAGMDGAIADGQGEPFPLVTTISSDCIGNLTRNLKQYLHKGGNRRKVVFSTSQNLSPRKQRNLYERAGELGFTLIQLYERSAIASRLYRNPVWCRELLQLTGTPSALSVVPLTRRPIINNDMIGRDEALEWLQRTRGDRLLIGEPGAGKTSLLSQLTKLYAALFVVNKDMGEIANAIREQQPQYIIVDDAHVDTDFLVALKRVRTEISADFEIIASCWNGGFRSVSDALNVPDTHIFTLKRLSRDQMVDVIAEAGIRGVNWLVREIVTQAEGLPGLAVTLTHLCLQGNVKRIQTAEALSSTILDFYVKRVEIHVQEILAAFALGGDAGMYKHIVAHELNIPLYELRKVLAELATGGVIAEVDFSGDILKVRPSAFRHALIREIFFSGAAALPYQTLNTLLNQTPNLIETTKELIHVKARGGHVPEQLLQKYLTDLNTVSEIWTAYAWIGYAEAEWVLEHYQGAVANIAYPLLNNIPQRAIPELISEAVNDDRLLNATPEHPLRRLQDWIHEAYPGSGQAVTRRKLLFESTKRWLLKNNDAVTGYKVLLNSLDPRFESHTPDPGSGNTITLHSAHLTAQELTELQEIWFEILSLTNKVPVSDWQVFIDLIRHWAYPYKNYSEDAGNIMREFAKQMVESLTERTKDLISVTYTLRRSFESLMPEFIVDIDSEIDTLYPLERLNEDWREQEKTWQTGVNDLAIQWQNRSPEINIHRLEEIEKQMSGANYRYPRLTPSLAQQLAQQTDDPIHYAKTILNTSLPSDILFPFLSKAVRENYSDWEIIVEACFDNQQLCATATQIILTLEQPPENLLQEAVAHAGQFPRMVEFLYLRDELPSNLLLVFLSHPEPAVAQGAALAEWQRDPKSTVRDWLRSAWEQAILAHDVEDYWLGDIFKVEQKLAYAWLMSRIKNDNFEPYRFDHAIEVATSNLQQSERLHLLEIVPVRYGYHDIVARIVADDLEVFRELLSLTHLADFHLAPLSGDVDTIWQKKAKYAFQAGYSAEKIAIRTMLPVGVVVTWSGNLSEQHKGWLERFNKLQEIDDQIIKSIAQSGSQLCEKMYKDALEREYIEDVYGRD